MMKRRSVPRRIGEAKPPGIFSKAKWVLFSLAGSEYHDVNRLQLAAAINTRSQSPIPARVTVSRRGDQPVSEYRLLRTCAIIIHRALVLLPCARIAPRPVGRPSQISPSQPTEDSRAVQVLRADGGKMQEPRQALARQ